MNNYNRELIVATILYLIAVSISVLFIIFYNYHHLLSWIVHPIMSFFIGIKLINNWIKKTRYNSKTLIICTFLVSVTIASLLLDTLLEPKSKWRAYSDGVISGAEIDFKEDNKFCYTTSTLLGNFRYYGTYKKLGNDISLIYNSNKPTLDSEKLYIHNDKLFFVLSGDEKDYRFYISKHSE